MGSRGKLAVFRRESSLSFRLLSSFVGAARKCKLDRFRHETSRIDIYSRSVLESVPLGAFLLPVVLRVPSLLPRLISGRNCWAGGPCFLSSTTKRVTFCSCQSEATFQLGAFQSGAEGQFVGPAESGGRWWVYGLKREAGRDLQEY